MAIELILTDKRFKNADDFLITGVSQTGDEVFLKCRGTLSEMQIEDNEVRQDEDKPHPIGTVVLRIPDAELLCFYVGVGAREKAQDEGYA